MKNNITISQKEIIELFLNRDVTNSISMFDSLAESDLRKYTSNVEFYLNNTYYVPKIVKQWENLYLGIAKTTPIGSICNPPIMNMHLQAGKYTIKSVETGKYLGL